MPEMPAPDLDRLVPADEALATVLRDVHPTPTQWVKLIEAGGRTLADDLAARRTQPPFDASAMDGYAIRHEDLATLPARLRLVGVSRAGEPFESPIGPGESVRIFTGAVVPEGADTIVIQEDAESDGETVVVKEPVSRGRYVRPAGLDFSSGDVLLARGDVFSANRLALAAAMNHPDVPVHRSPVVALLATGDELVPPGQAMNAGQIIASNTFGLASAIQTAGGVLVDKGIVADNESALAEAITDCISLGADVIITTGGASVGDHDLVLPVARECGFDFEIAKIAMRPGKPFLFGRLNQEGRTVYLTGLAGNPVSSLVAFSVFVKPLIHALNGRKPETVTHLKARLGRDLPRNDGRAEYMRAVLTIGPDGERIATPFEKQDSSMLAKLVEANCLVYRAVNAEPAKNGDSCAIVLLD